MNKTVTVGTILQDMGIMEELKDSVHEYNNFFEDLEFIYIDDVPYIGTKNLSDTFDMRHDKMLEKLRANDYFKAFDRHAPKSGGVSYLEFVAINDT